MERCDFASIMGILRSYIREDQEQNQTDLMYLLFDSFVSDKENLDFDFDNGLVCRWLSGQARVSPRVSGYYFEQKHRRRLAYDLYGHIIPLLSDPGMAAEKVHSLILCDPSISESKKQELTKDYPCPGEEEAAEFLAEALSFGMGREFVKRDAKRKALTAVDSLSPVVRDLIYGAEVPKPCRHFCGREKELRELHALLEENRHVFLRGMAGIGKSELAKAYAKQYKKDYTNILYIPCTGDLKQDILDLDFADDLTASSQEERFRKHSRFLRALKADSLLILDNFHATDQEELLSVLLNYRCRILFTTRNLREEAAEYELGEMEDIEALLRLFGAFYDGTEKHRETVSEIIETVHRHTLAVELAARLLDCGMLRPKSLLKKLRAEKVKLDASDHIRITKDGRAAKETYYGHIHILFALYKLSGRAQEVLRNLTLAPLTGVSERRFAGWLELPDLNTVHDLTEMGLISRLPGRRIALQPMIREVALADLPPSVRRCKPLLRSIQNICLRHGADITDYKELFGTVESTILLAEKDDSPFYIRFLEDVFPGMEGCRFENGMSVVLDALTAAVEQLPQAKPRERALILDYQAAMEKNAKRATKLGEEAIAALGPVTADTAHLAANLHSNLGGRYREANQLELARQHMEHGISLLEQYDLTGAHDIVPQIMNYAVFLSDVGKAEEALSALEKLKNLVAKYSSDRCSDYALTLETMGRIYLVIGEVCEAIEAFKQATAVYETVWEEEPERIEAKKLELFALFPQAGISYGKQLEAISKKKRA